VAEIIFLGTGGAFSAGKRSNVAVMLKTEELSTLIECGPSILQQLARVGLCAGNVEHLFVSHSHGDHVLGFPMLVLGRLKAADRLHVYAGPNTIATLKMLWTLAYADFDSHYLRTDWHRLSERGADKTDLPNGVVLQTFEVPHPPGVQTLAARWDFPGGLSVAFATDTTPNLATVELARGCDILIHEASYSATLQPDQDPSIHFHSSAQQAGQIARDAGCDRLALVHLGTEGSDHPDVLAKEARADTSLDVLVPDDGDRVIL